MDKDKAPVHGGGDGFPTHSSRFSAFAASSSKVPFMGDPSPSSSSHSNPESSRSGQLSHDISRSPDFPPRNPGHRRAYSEILRFPDDTSFYSDLGIVGPSLSDDTDEDLLSAYLNIKKLNSSSVLSGGQPSGPAAAPLSPSQTENLASGLNERPRARHQHSWSMDGSSSVLLGSSSEGPTSAEMKKAISAAKLADLALVDPKRAKRIWANRQSAARSKERKTRYIAELEQKVQSLQTEAATLSARLTLVQRDTNGLTAENSELKLRLQTMEQQVHLQDALNDALREEVQRLKLATGQLMPNGGPLMNFGPPLFGSSQQFYHHNQAMQSLLAAHQFQQLPIHPQHQQQLHPLQPLQQQQLHLPQPQPPADLRMKCPMTSWNKRGKGTSDNSN
ncbi:transcription factor RF2a-like [Phoenix dactylifera]|uniref:Transcription factor RF2a-like n=1 Tax=Phoenix dactylifera TaxID=42345 RepID=A0A8B9AF33_PHODC|nr:transcription factor RF2a-like [Phoenix dactylifera]